MLLYWMMICAPHPGEAQRPLGFTMPPGEQYIEMDFEMYSNLIVIPVTLNNILTVKFVVDTGAESTILTEKIFGDVLGIPYVREISVQGPGIMDSLKAYVGTGVRMSLPGGVSGDGFNLLVLKEDYLELNKTLGEDVYGILGYDFFSRFVVNINYDDRKIRLYDPKKYKPRKKDMVYEMPILKTKPYLNLSVIQNNSCDSVKLMVDSGASHALLLDVEHLDHVSFPGKLIPRLIGQGLGGEIPGFIGRMDHCVINGFSFDDVLVSIPEPGAYLKAIKRGARHGTIGGEMLSRFEVTFDYTHEKLYLRKGQRFRQHFETNMSGMVLSADGEDLKLLKVVNIEENSPAAMAGIQEGDVILRINRKNLKNSHLSVINSMLRRNEGYKLKVVLVRDQSKIEKSFRLQRMI